MAAMSIDRAREFLAHERIALVGISRNEKDFSRMVFKELVRRGHDLVPVNPALKEIEGRPCFSRLQDIQPPVDAALVLTSPDQTERVVHDCLEAGIHRVWMHRGVGRGAASASAIAFCEANGIEVVTDLCPFMALPGAGLPHRVHGFFRRALGRRLPARA